MSNLPTPTFNHGAPAAQHRELGRQTLRQFGHEFSLRHDYIGVDPDYTGSDEPEPEKATSVVDEKSVKSKKAISRDAVLAAAQKKLDGFSSVESEGADKENAKAKEAERLA